MRLIGLPKKVKEVCDMEVKKLFLVKYESACPECGCETKIACILAKDSNEANERFYKGEFLCKDCTILELSNLYILIPYEVAEGA